MSYFSLLFKRSGFYLYHQMILPQNFRILAESQNYILGNVFEYGSIIDRRSGEEIYIGESYGDPEFGLIDKNETWAILLGYDSYLWTPTEILKLSVFEEILKWPFEARQVTNFEVEILSDPWRDDPGVYLFNTQTKAINRVRDFKRLDFPYDAYDKSKIVW